MHPNCLQRADEIVHGDRNAAYGEPKDNHGTTAEAFSVFMRRKYPWFQSIEAEDVCWFNICQKTSREMNSKTVDGPVDLCGYSANIEILRSGKTVAEIREQRKATDIEQIKQQIRENGHCDGCREDACGCMLAGIVDERGKLVEKCPHCYEPSHGARPCPKRLSDQLVFKGISSGRDKQIDDADFEAAAGVANQQHSER